MSERSLLSRFLVPRVNRWFFLRLVVLATCAYVFFGRVCRLTWANGSSMEPTYADGSLNFCWYPRYRSRPPERGDVVMVRLADAQVMLFKRVVAVAGDTVAFRDGVLVVNGEEVREDYVTYPCDWDLEEREVKPGHVYVVGDNRSMPMARHVFGQTPLERIAGGPLW